MRRAAASERGGAASPEGRPGLPPQQWKRPGNEIVVVETPWWGPGAVVRVMQEEQDFKPWRLAAQI